MTSLILNLFRVTSLMLTAGDRLVENLGLTSARWQVLGTIVAADRPQPVSWLARDMGVNRQNVQRIVNDLVKEGFVTMASNPHHRRAQLVTLTDKGELAYDDAMKLQLPWINKLSDGLKLKDIESTHNVLVALRQKLEGTDASDGEV